MMIKSVSKNKGSILVEAMVAMAIFAIGMSFVLLLFVSSSKGALLSLEGTKASLMDTQAMEAVRSVFNDRGWLPVGTYEVGVKDNKEWDIISTDGLVGHWELSGDADDYSGNDNHGTLVGGVTWAEDRMGQARGAAEFDGVGGYVDLGNLNDYLNPNNMSWSFWVKPTRNARDTVHSYNFDTFIGKHGGGASGDLTVGYIRDNIVRVYYENLASGSYIDSLQPIPINSWTYVVVTTDASGVNLYINGVFNSRGNISTNFVITNVGVGNAIPDIYSTYFDGQIDDVRIYNRALSEDEIKALYGHYSEKHQSKVTVGDGVTDGLVGYWPMNEGEGNYVYDYSPRTDNWGKMFGPYLSFDGVDDYVDIGSPLGNWNELTIGVWVKAPQYTGTNWPGYVGGNASGSSYNIGIGIWQATNHQWLEIDTTTGNYPMEGSIGIPWGEWYYATLVYDGSSLTEYVNGVEGRSIVASGTLNSLTTILAIGRTALNTANIFKGLIDDVRIYNRALSPEEISKSYKGEWVSDTGLVGHWDMDEGYGGQVRDKSGNGNHGTINGATWGDNSPEWVDDVSGGALEFDGVDDYVQTPVLSGDSGAFCAWIKPNNLGSIAYVGGSADEATTNRYFGFLRIDENRKPTIMVYNNGSPYNIIIGSTTLQTGQWYHICTLSNASAYKVYVNGIEEMLTISVGLNDGNWLSAVSDRDNTTIGALTRSWSSYFFNGQISDVRIYNRALSADEIQKIYEYGRTNKFYISE